MNQDRGDASPRPPSTEAEGSPETVAINAAAGTEPKAKPPEEIRVGSRPQSESRPGWIAAFAISLAISIVLHAAVIGADLVRLPSLARPDEAAVPVTVVEDPQPKQQPKPKTDAAAPKEEPKSPEPKTPEPKTQEAKPPEPETAAQQKEPQPTSPAPSPPETASPKDAPNTAESSPPPKGAKEKPTGPAATVLGDTSAHETVAALRAQIERCWTIPTGWTNPHQVAVVLDVQLDRNGALAARPVLLEFSATEIGMAAAKNALAAVARCAPYKLPPDQYDKWHEAEVKLAPD